MSQTGENLVSAAKAPMLLARAQRDPQVLIRQSRLLSQPFRLLLTQPA